MRTYGSRSWRALGLLLATIIVAVLGLLPWRLAAQTQETQTKEGAAVPDAKKLAKAVTTSGSYKITIDDIRREDDRRFTMEPNAFPMTGMQGFERSETKTTPNGQTTTGGGGMSGGGGMGGAFAVPNLILDISVKGPRTDGKRQLICALNGKVVAVDDIDRTLDCPAMPAWMRAELVGVKYDRTPGKAAIHLALPKNEPPATYLKSIDGELLVAEAAVTQIAFRGKDLSHPTKKQGGGVSAQFEKLTESPKGIDVQFTAMPTAKAKPNFNAGGNMMEHMRKQMLANTPGRISVLIEDSEGEMHSPTSTRVKSSGSESREEKRPNGSTSFSSSGASSGGSIHQSFGPGGSSDSSEIPAGDPNSKYDSYLFDPLPDGVTVKSVVCRVTDFVAEPRPVRFHFEGVRLP